MNSTFPKHINTTSIDDHPKINPNVLKSEWDTWFLAKATAYGRRFSETVSFKEIIDEEVFPGLDVQTDEQWQQFIKDTINIDVKSWMTYSFYYIDFFSSSIILAAQRRFCLERRTASWTLI